MAHIATELMVSNMTGGKKFAEYNFKLLNIPHFGVKEAVFPFNMFQEVDPILGPEMRSTGEVLGLSDSFGLAFYKAQEATQVSLPESGTVLISVTDRDKAQALEVAKEFIKLGFRIKATAGTHKYLSENNVVSELVNKIHEGRPNIVDSIMNKEIQLIINTPIGKKSQDDDSYIRKTAIKYKISYITTMAAANSSVKGISAFKESKNIVKPIKSLQEYHGNIG